MSAVMNTERVRDDRERAQKWFSRHLWEVTGVDIQSGVTMPQGRVKRIREAIAEHGMAEKVMGRFNNRPETYKEFLARALGIDLDTPL